MTPLRPHMIAALHAILPHPFLGPGHSAFPHLLRLLHGSAGASRPAAAQRSPGLGHPVERPPSGPSPRLLGLDLSRSLCLQGGSRQPPPCLARGPYGHLHLPESGACTPPHRPPRGQGVSPPLPATWLARWLAAPPPRRLAPCELDSLARHHPPVERAGRLRHGPAITAPAPVPTCGSLSDLWCPNGPRDAGVGLAQGLGGDQLSGRAWP